MRILLLDTTLYEPASPLFVDAVRTSGHEFRFIDEAVFLRPLERSLVHKIGYRLLGSRPLSYWSLNGTLCRAACEFRPEIVLVVKGAYVKLETLRRIKAETDALLLNFATDDPFNPANSTPDLIRGIPAYDLYACTKRAIMTDVQRAGCRRVVHVHFAYKPELHFPEVPATREERGRFSADVVFVGGVDQDRLPYINAITGLPNVSVALYGSYWQRYPRLRPFARGFAVGRDYRLALGGAKIALCLVRRANRDGHVMRTFEIPACGAFMLAERTDEHLTLFREGIEAAYFGSPGELADKVRYYLAHKEERQAIAAAGHARVTTAGHTYRDRLATIIDAVSGL